MKKLFRIGPILRMSFGIISFMVSLVLFLDVFLDALPNERKTQAEIRKQVSQALSAQFAASITAESEPHQLQDLLYRVLTYNQNIRSIGIRRSNHTLFASSRNHDKEWKFAEAKALPTHVIVPLIVDKKHWGDVELLFVDPDPSPLSPFLHHPAVVVIFLFSTLGLAGVYLFLKGTLRHIDPSHVVPQRVRAAFDTLAEAVVILDAKSQVVLTNAAFDQLNSSGQEQLEGKSIRQLEWLMAPLSKETQLSSTCPWDEVLRTGKVLRDRHLKVTLFDGSLRELSMNCSAVNDSSGVVRGCLVTFDDITQLSQANALLQHTLHDLELSAEKIKQQNEELQKHAHFDHLTGCMNRRAFFARAEPLYQEAAAGKIELVCIMVDIDFFKSFNDRYGHAVGDLVIQQVAAKLGRSLRAEDLLCRYGGEEFCILLVNTNDEIGAKVAERIRARIEKECGPGVRSVPGLHVTASLGLASLRTETDVESIEQLIEHADHALYTAKKSGRNRVAGTKGEILSSGEAREAPVAQAARA